MSKPIYSKNIQLNLKNVQKIEKEIQAVFSKYNFPGLKAHFLFLCIHEHLVNLYRHGRFDGVTPEVEISINFLEEKKSGLSAIISDNSQEYSYKRISGGIGLSIITKLCPGYTQKRENNLNILQLEKKF